MSSVAVTVDRQGLTKVVQDGHEMPNKSLTEAYCREMTTRHAIVNQSSLDQQNANVADNDVDETARVIDRVSYTASIDRLSSKNYNLWTDVHFI